MSNGGEKRSKFTFATHVTSTFLSLTWLPHHLFPMIRHLTLIFKVGTHNMEFPGQNAVLEALPYADQMLWRSSTIAWI